MSDRETITGTLHVIRIRKRYNGILEDIIGLALEQDGILETREYPPTYWIETERRDYTDKRAFIYRFRGRPKAFDREMEGATVTVTANVEPWQNNLGAYLTQPRVLNVKRTNDE